MVLENMTLAGCMKRTLSSDGITNLGKGLGTQIKKHTQKENPRVIVGHDYRSYSEEIKTALKKGLISTGCHIEDVGLIIISNGLFCTIQFRCRRCCNGYSKS